MKNKMNKNKKSKEELLKIFESIGEDLLANPENAEIYLKESGYDIEEFQKESLNFIDVLKGKSRLELARKKRNRLVEQIKNYWNKIDLQLINKSREELIKILIASHGEQLSFQFRNLEKLSDDDMLEMAKEEQLLEYLEKIKNA